MIEIRSTVDAEQLRQRSARWLGLGGLVPFWTLPLLRFFEEAMGTQWLVAAEQWVLIYGVTIVSFMGGGRWVFRLFDPATHPAALFGGFLGAVMPPLVAWVVASLPDVVLGSPLGPLARLAIIALLLLYQLFQDVAHRAVMPGWYVELRIVLTVGATTPIVLAIILAAIA